MAREQAVSSLSDLCDWSCRVQRPLHLVGYLTARTPEAHGHFRVSTAQPRLLTLHVSLPPWRPASGERGPTRAGPHASV